VSAALFAAAGVLLVARRRLGGVTGDVLGACVELALAAYLVSQVVGG
jgi:cobalamin synthase